MIIKAKNGHTFKRIHDGFEFGEEIHLGIDYSTGTPREDKLEFYEEIRNTELATPPQMSGYGVIIPEKFEWVFANDRFEINGFVVDFARVDGELVVDVAYLQWAAFQQELDLPENKTVNDSLLPIWKYVQEQVAANNLIAL